MAKRRSREKEMHQTGMDPTMSEACEFLDELGPDKYAGFSEVPWERFRARLEEAWRTPASERKAASGRPPWDAVMMFKALVMGRLNNLSDEKLAVQLRSDISLMRFVGVNRNTSADREDAADMPRRTGRRDRGPVRGVQ